MKLEIELIHPDAKIPTKSNKYDAGYDLYSIEDGIILPGKRALIPTGLKMAIPIGLYGRIAPRSGLAVRNGIDTLAGVVDACYKNEICVILLNTDKNEYKYKKGDRIAQIIITPCESPEMAIVDKLSSLDRGGGFGSTGN